MLVPVIVILAIVLTIGLSAIVMSSYPTSSTLVSAISSSRQYLTAHPNALGCWPSGIVFVPVVAPPAFMVHPGRSLLLFSYAALVTSVFFAHLLLNTMWFLLQLWHFSSVWPQIVACFAVHPTRLHLCSQVWCGPEKWPHEGVLLHLLSIWPHLQQCSHLLDGPAVLND